MLRLVDPWHGRQDPSARRASVGLQRTRIRYLPKGVPSEAEIAEAMKCVDEKRARLSFLAAVPEIESSVSSPLCLLVSDETRGRTTEKKAVFRTKGPLPPGSLVRLGSKLVISSPEHVVLHMAKYLSDLEITWLACTLCAVYSIHPRLGSAGKLWPARPLTTVEQIMSYLERAAEQKVHWSRKALAATARAINAAASPKEIECALLMTLPKSMGGYALPRPTLNGSIGLDHRMASPGQWDDFSVDALWAGQKLALEYDSDSIHMDPHRRARDNAKRNALEAMGYRVLPFSTKQLDSTVLTDGVMKSIAGHLGIRQRYTDTDYDWQGRRSSLRRDLRRLSHGAVGWTARSMRARSPLSANGMRQNAGAGRSKATR